MVELPVARLRTWGCIYRAHAGCACVRERVFQRVLRSASSKLCLWPLPRIVVFSLYDPPRRNPNPRLLSYTPFPPRGFRMLWSQNLAKPTFARWRALPLERDLTPRFGMTPWVSRSPSGSSLHSLPLRTGTLRALGLAHSGRQKRLIRPARPVWTSCLRHRRKGRWAGPSAPQPCGEV